MRRLLLLLNNDSGTNYPDYPDNLIAIYTTTNHDEEPNFNNYGYPYEKNVEDLGDGTYRVEIYSDEDFSSFRCNTNTLTMDYLKVTKNVTSMIRMFFGCNSLTSLDVSNWDTSNVTNMNYMFDGCASLKSLPLIGSWNTSSITNMHSMFDGCTSLTSLDLSGWDTSNVNNMNYMFYGCTNLKHVNLSNFNLDKCTAYTNIFCNCKSLLEIEMYNCSTDTISKIISSDGFPIFTDGSVHKIYVDSAEVVKGLTTPTGWDFTYSTPDLESLKINLLYEDIYVGDEIQLTFNYYPVECMVSKMDLEWSIIDGEKYAEIKEINYDGCVISALEPGMFTVQLEDKNTGVYSNIDLEVLKTTLLLKSIYTTTNPDGDHTFNNGDIYPYEKNVEDLGDGTYRVEIYSYKDFSRFRCNTNTLTIDYLEVTDTTTSLSFIGCTNLVSINIENWITTNLVSCYFGTGTSTASSLTRIYALNYKDIDSINKVLANLPSNNGSMVLVDRDIDGIKINSEHWTVLSIEHARAFDSECFSLIPRSTITIDRSPLDVAEYIYDKKFFVKEGNKFQLISEGLSEIICKLNSGSEEIFKISTAYIENKNLYYPACDIKLISDTIEPVIGNNFTINSDIIETLPSHSNDINYYSDTKYLTKRNYNTFLPWSYGASNIEYKGKYVSGNIKVNSAYNYGKSELVIVYTNNGTVYYPKTKGLSDPWETTTINGAADGTSIITASSYPTSLKFDNTYNNRTIFSIDYIRTDNINDMSYMFEECNNLTSIPHMDTSNVTDMTAMFRGCSILGYLDLSWSTFNVNNMSSMFENCSSLYELYVNSWDTSNVMNMSWMFRGCTSLTSVDLSNWSTYNVQDMSYMFNECYNLGELNLSNFDMSSVYNVECMFGGCYNLTSLRLDYCSYDTVDKIINSTDFPVDNYGTIYCSSDVYNSGLTPPGNWTFEVV